MKRRKQRDGILTALKMGSGLLEVICSLHSHCGVGVATIAASEVDLANGLYSLLLRAGVGEECPFDVSKARLVDLEDPVGGELGHPSGDGLALAPTGQEQKPLQIR
jgi:hypothetical protein